MSIHTFIGARSHFSLGESMLAPKQIVAKAVALGAKAVTITDTMTISGMVEFTSAAKKAGIKPIIGARIRIVDDPLYRKPKKMPGEEEKPNPEWFCNLFVRNDAGMKELIKLLTKGHSDEHFYYVPRVGFQDVLDTIAMGNVTFSTSDFYSVFHRKDYMSILEQVRTATASNENAFIEVSPINTPLFHKLNSKALEASVLTGIRAVVSHPALYEDDEDASTLEVMAAISTNTKMDAPWRSQQFVKTFSTKSISSLINMLKVSLDGISKFYPATKVGPELAKSTVTNLSLFDHKHEYVWVKQPLSLPVMAENEFIELTRQIKEGWKERLTVETMGFKPSKEQLPIYVERLRYEVGVLKTMEFERYFLMVSDLVNWSKKNDILVGPGRGSAGGSLVAYLMGITDVDPIRFGLIFERFINPDRLDLPDVDLDFMSSRRHEVIDYLVEKYGEENVAGISNYGTMASASALRDCGRVHNLSNDEMSATRYVPKEHGSPVALGLAAEQVPSIMEFRNNNTEIWNHALKLEGKMRSLGRHAAGIVVTGEPIVNRAVIETRSGSKVVNWDKRVIEDQGFVKMDILGLSTLDTIGKSLNLIQERHGKKITLTKLPLDDKEVLKAFADGETTGVFQFEGGSAKKMLRSMGKTGEFTFNDIVATNALNRPGPLDAGLASDYVSRKSGMTPVSYPHNRVENALLDTYGVLVYQETLMEMAKSLCGFSMSEADTLRKAIGKKDSDLMKSMRDAFVDRAIAGFVEVELSDGRTIELNNGIKHKVLEDEGEYTVSELFKNGLTPKTPLFV